MDELWKLPEDIQSYMYENDVPLHIYSSPISDAFEGLDPEVGIATVIVSNENGEILFIEHSESDRFWELPSGHIKEGENPENAGRREVREETGYLLTDIEALFVIIWPFEDTVRLQVVFRAVAGEQIESPDDETVRIRWKTEVPDNVTFGELGHQMYEYYLSHSEFTDSDSYLRQGLALVGVGLSAAAFKGLQSYRERKNEDETESES